jgi:predicted RNase H-like nuclease (RuvC/YqgF family)
VEEVIRQALLELRSRVLVSRSEDGDSDVLDELKDRCVALREALDAAHVETEARTRKAEELRALNNRLAQANREILAAAQRVSIQVGTVQDELCALSREAGDCLAGYQGEFNRVLEEVREKMTTAVSLSHARANIEEQYQNEIRLVQAHLRAEKEENEHLNEKIASLKKCVFSEHLENQVNRVLSAILHRLPMRKRLKIVQRRETELNATGMKNVFRPFASPCHGLAVKLLPTLLS